MIIVEFAKRDGVTCIRLNSGGAYLWVPPTDPLFPLIAPAVE